MPPAEQLCGVVCKPGGADGETPVSQGPKEDKRPELAAAGADAQARLAALLVRLERRAEAQLRTGEHLLRQQRAHLEQLEAQQLEQGAFVHQLLELRLELGEAFVLAARAPPGRGQGELQQQSTGSGEKSRPGPLTPALGEQDQEGRGDADLTPAPSSEGGSRQDFSALDTGGATTVNMRNYHLRHTEVVQHFDDGSRSAKISEYIQSDAVEFTFGFLILLNTVVLSLEMEYIGVDVGYELEFRNIDRPASKMWPGAEDAFWIMNVVFLALFCLELFARIWALRAAFFKARLNWIDMMVVAISVVDVLAGNHLGFNPFLVRLLRMARLTRCLRMIKAVNLIQSFHLIGKSIVASFQTLFWSVLILLVIQWLVAMLMFQLIHSWLADEGNSDSDREAVFVYFGTFHKTLITVIEITFVNYTRASRALTDNIDMWYSWVFVVYRMVVSFGVVNVLRAVFINSTMKVAETDHELMMKAALVKSKKFAMELESLWDIIDVSGKGVISFTEFQAARDDPLVSTWLDSLGVETKHPDVNYNTLCNEDGLITRAAFFRGAAQLKGTAKASDVHFLGTKMKDLAKKLEAISRESAYSPGKVARTVV